MESVTRAIFASSKLGVMSKAFGLLLVLLGSMQSAWGKPWQQHPHYLEIQQSCFKGHPMASFARINTAAFLSSLSSGLKHGLFMDLAGGFERVDSSPYMLGLVECYGDDELGVNLAVLTHYQMIVTLSIAKGTSVFGLSYLSGLFSVRLTSALKTPVVAARLEAYCSRLGRAAPVLKSIWAGRRWIIAGMVATIATYREITKYYNSMILSLKQNEDYIFDIERND